MFVQHLFRNLRKIPLIDKNNFLQKVLLIDFPFFNLVVTGRKETAHLSFSSLWPSFFLNFILRKMAFGILFLPSLHQYYA